MDQNVSYDASTTPITEQQVSDMQRVSGHQPKKSWVVKMVVVSLVAGGILAYASSGGAAERWALFSGSVFVIVAISLSMWWSEMNQFKKAAVRHVRLVNFANDNGLIYESEIANPAYPGVIFDIGDKRHIYDQLRLSDAGNVEVGNYSYSLKNRNSTSTTYRHGYIRIKLDRHVVHMLLDGRANNANAFGYSISNLPVAMMHNQTLALEGDFNNHFTLYAPKEYERDALYIFTPDLMALLIDYAGQFDVEVIDDQLFVYGHEFNLLDEPTWNKIFAIITKVGQKTIAQTDFYADENIGNRQIDIVATEGRRLRKGLPWVAAVAIGIYIIMIILQVITH